MAYTQLVSLKGPQGAPGQGTLSGQGAPAAGVGVTGSFYRDLTNSFEYGPKLTDGSWSGAQIISIIGPSGPPGAPGAAATIPNDLTANSLAIAPVSGDATASGITQKNSGGSTVFSTDATGGVQSAGAMSIAGAVTLGSTLGVTGATNLAAVTASGNVSVGGTLAVTGASNVSNVTASGLVTAANVTLSSGGKLTYADGTFQSTSAPAVPSRSVVYAGTNSANLAANGTQNTYFYYVANATGNIGFAFRFPFAGAVVGVSVSNSASATNPILVQFNKNGTGGTTYNIGAPGGTSNTAYQTWPVTTLPYAAGDVLLVNTGSTVAGAFVSEVYITIQWTA